MTKLCNKNDINISNPRSYVYQLITTYFGSTQPISLGVILETNILPTNRQNMAIKLTPILHHKIIKNLYKKIWVKSREEVASKQNLNNNTTEITLSQNIRTSLHDTKEYKFNTWLQSFIQYNASPFTISSID